MKRIITKQEASEYCGSRANLQRLIDAEWVHPIMGKQKLQEIDRQELDRAIDRLQLEGGWAAVKPVLVI